MAQLGQNFDATQVEPRADFEPVPPDEYLVQIVGSEMKDTKDRAGQYLQLEMDVLDGDFKGRKLFDRLNLINGNAQTVEIANRTLSAICHATGVLNVSDSEQLHLIPFVAKVVVKPPQGQYSASNEVKAYRPANGGAAASNVAPMRAVAPARTTATRPAPQQAQPQKQAAGGKPPWRR